VLKDIYHLTNKVGFSAEYIESISPAERGMHLLYYREEEDKKRKAKQQGSNSAPMMGRAMDTMGSNNE